MGGRARGRRGIRQVTNEMYSSLNAARGLRGIYRGAWKYKSNESNRLLHRRERTVARGSAGTHNSPLSPIPLPPLQPLTHPTVSSRKGVEIKIATRAHAFNDVNSRSVSGDIPRSAIRTAADSLVSHHECLAHRNAMSVRRASRISATTSSGVIWKRRVCGRIAVPRVHDSNFASMWKSASSYAHRFLIHFTKRSGL